VRACVCVVAVVVVLVYLLFSVILQERQLKTVTSNTEEEKNQYVYSLKHNVFKRCIITENITPKMF
jgi:hypothetical protein